MKNKKVTINKMFPQNGNNIFWEKWKAYGTTDVAEFMCRPTKAHRTNKAFTFIFGNYFTVKLPAKHDCPCLGKWITATTPDGIKIQIESGEFRSASYNWGDPLPSRWYVERIRINEEIVDLYKYVYRYYPWYKNDICSVIRLVKNILEIYERC